MPRARWIRTARLGGTAAAASLLLAGCSASDIDNKFNFGWPDPVTKQAERMQTLWHASTLAALVVGVAVWGLIFWCCIRYRKTTDDFPKQTKFNHALEVFYSIVPVIIVLVLFYFTATTQNYVTKLSKNPDTTISVVAFQWNWQFDYCDQPYKGDEKTRDEDACITGEYVNTTGTAEVIPILVVPRGETVRIIEHSNDVIHSFWVPDFLFKRDVIPQPIDNQFEFTATTNGHYVGRCAELCGTYHSQMNFEVRVVDPEAYRTYLTTLATLGASDTAAQQKALEAIGESPFADTTRPFNTDRTTRSASTK
ncbi:MAG: cytochrome c oxidase subunit 2 [Pseudonocardiales bacterium]|nr:cytochrome c oxidase subunit 2 [Jatrophihabitantaceae bacterium]MCW2602214.1 cytochrome c oxidase subunit 2 [Pseudonocardiales bacterium]